MEGELGSIAKVSAIATASMAFARFASRRLHPGFSRLGALLPVLALLPILPFSFTSINLRGASAFFLAWLGVFKILLLAFGRGPLDPSLHLLPFAFSAAFPVKLRPSNSKLKPASRFLAKLILSSAAKLALLTALASLCPCKSQMHPYIDLPLFGLHIYLALTLLLASPAVVCTVLGMELEPQFNKPYLATSLRDFWGRRWNLMASSILRLSIYEPIRACFGTEAGIVATFVVSGLMHEVLLYYLTLRQPTGEMTAFFVLHGACVAIEAWWASRKGWWRPQPAMAALLTQGFLAVTGLWLFFATLVRNGTKEKMLAEYATAAEVLEETARVLFSSAASALDRS